MPRQSLDPLNLHPFEISNERFKDFAVKHELEIVKETSQDIYIHIGSITKLLGFSQLHSATKHFTATEKCKLPYKTKGGPQKITCFNKHAVLKILCSSRKQKAVQLCKELDVPLVIKFVTPETTFIGAVLQTFKGHEMIQQYKVENYFIDLYFPQYNIAVEFDEYAHLHRRREDIQRQNCLLLKLNCIIIRVFQDDNLYEALNKIHTVIYEKLTNTHQTKVVNIVTKHLTIRNSLPPLPETVKDMREFYTEWTTTMKEQYDMHKKEYKLFQWKKLFDDYKVMGKRHHQMQDWLKLLDSYPDKTNQLLTLFENFAAKHDISHTNLVKKVFYYMLRPNVVHEKQFIRFIPLLKEILVKDGYFQEESSNR